MLAFGINVTCIAEQLPESGHAEERVGIAQLLVGLSWELLTRVGFLKNQSGFTSGQTWLAG